MSAPEKRLTDLPIFHLLGMHLFIPRYQRGYRWTSKQVEDLLNDIWSYASASLQTNESGKFYCLQPVVVKPKRWVEEGQPREGWEVIDGQQRLTMRVTGSAQGERAIVKFFMIGPSLSSGASTAGNARRQPLPNARETR